jgi:hypothetical protein
MKIYNKCKRTKKHGGIQARRFSNVKQIAVDIRRQRKWYLDDDKEVS